MNCHDTPGSVIPAAKTLLWKKGHQKAMILQKGKMIFRIRPSSRKRGWQPALPAFFAHLRKRAVIHLRMTAPLASVPKSAVCPVTASALLLLPDAVPLRPAAGKSR